jgi:hypothetical protein
LESSTIFAELADLTRQVDNLALDAWEVNSKVKYPSLFHIIKHSSDDLQLVAHSVATYAISLDAFPKRTSENFNTAANEQYLYHGPELVM